MKTGAIYRACHTLIWVNLVFYIAILLAIIFECHPIEETWNPVTNSADDHCVNRFMILIVSAAVNVFFDLLNLLLPVWAIWQLQMASKRKAGITAIFATGLL